MRKIYAFFVASLFLVGTHAVTAQTFTVHDTVRFSYTGTGVVNVGDDITNTSTVVTDSVKITWKVIATDFPADWQGASGICDNKLCYNFVGLWPGGAAYTSNPYPNGAGDFHLQTALRTSGPPAFEASNGCHYVTVRMRNAAVFNDSATTTFVVCKMPVAVPTTPKASDEISLYPNPASNELNVVFEGNNDINCIAVYNIIGKMMNVYKVTGTSANLNLENIPSGIYFIRLFNTQGGVMATRKFTKN